MRSSHSFQLFGCALEIVSGLNEGSLAGKSTSKHQASVFLIMNFTSILARNNFEGTTQLFRLYAVLLTFSFVLLACGEDDSTTPEPPAGPAEAAGTIGTAGGTLQSSDGRLVVTIPEGALPTETQISVREVDPSDRVDAFPGLEAMASLILEPAGLEFLEPVTLTLEDAWTEVPAKDEAVFWPLPVGILSGGDGQGGIRYVTPQFSGYTYKPDQAVIADLVINGIPEAGEGEHAYVDLGRALDLQTGQVNALSLQAQYAPPTSGTEGFEQTLGVDWRLRGAALNVGNMRYHEYQADGLNPLPQDGGTLGVADEGEQEDGSHLYSMGVRYTLGGVGSATWQFGMSADITLDQEEIWPESNHFKVDVVSRVILRYPPLEMEVVEDEPAEGEVENGLYSFGFSFEGVSVMRSFGSWTYNNTLVASSSNNGTQLKSLASGEGLSNVYAGFETPGVGNFGGFGVASESDWKSQAPEGTILVRFGPTGGVFTQWDNEEEQWSWSQIFAIQRNITDAQPYHEGPGSGGFVYADNTFGYVYFVEYDPELTSWEFVGNITSFPGTFDNPVTAAARSDGPAVCVTDGTPGRIYFHDREDYQADAVFIGECGDSPRRIRTAGNLAAISNFGSGTLTILTWSPQDEVELVGTVNVGDGPIGIDLIELDGGNIGVVSTGFNDNTYTITILSSTGSVVSNTTANLPAGATGPGHAIWLQDDGNRVLVTCNTSGHLFVADPDL